MTGFPNALPADSADARSPGARSRSCPIEIEGQQVRRIANVLYEVPLALPRQRRRRRSPTTCSRSSRARDRRELLHQGPVVAQPRRRRRARLATARSRSRAPSTPTKVVVGHDLRRRRWRCPGGKPGVAQGAGALRARRRGLRRAPGRPARHRGARRADRRVGPVRAHAPGRRRTSSPTPARWIDPASGELQVRFVNERQDQVYFQFPVAHRGDRPSERHRHAPRASSSATTGRSPSAGLDLDVAAGRDLRPRRAQRRRQDDDAADPRDAARARRAATPRSPARRSAGTPTTSVASSGSCRTASGSTTT